jgi:hypothetical protein
MSPTATKPHTYVADITQLPKALQHITRQKRWVVWRWQLRKRKNGAMAWTKPPYQCSNPKTPAKSNNPGTWGTYAEAVAAVAAGLADCIGFMLKDSEVAAADLDHARDAQTGEIIGWAKRLCVEADQLGLYREVTVSGSGLRFIGLSHGSELHRKFTFDRKSGASIELYRNTCRYITISGLQEGACDELGSIDDYLDTLVARFDGQPTATPSYFDFNTAGAQTDYFRNLIENGAPEGERSEKFQEVVWHLASLGWTPEQIVDELSKYPNGIGAKYAARLLAEVTRSFGKWQRRRRASAQGAGAAAAMNTSWPQIKTIPGELPRIVNEAEEALLLLPGREIYQRGGMLVRPVLNQSLKASADRDTESWQLVPVTRSHLVETLCCAAQFLRYDKRAKKFMPTDALERVAETYLNRQGRWKLPLLVGIVNAPFLRADGSICETSGYDPESHLLLKPESQVFPPVPQHPSRADAEVALEQLQNLIATFPFVAATDRAVELAGILTVLDRRSMSTAPLIAFTSPTAGTGKSLLVDLMSVLATGKLMPVLSQSKNEEEFEKRLGASLLASDVCIAIDNCEAPLSGALLCQALTQGELNIRVLGYSRNVGTAMNATIFATGNNLVIAGDLTRRCLLGSVDAGVERPELRNFNIDIIEETHTRRGELVVAALTILRSWHVAQQVGEFVQAVPYGGFVDWSRRVREPLIWLGEADPCDTVAKVRENDPQRDWLMTVVMQWKANLVLDQTYTVQNVIERAVNVPSFYNALFAIAASRTGGAVSNEKLGRWLKRIESKIICGFKLVQSGSRAGYSLWRLTQG